MPKLFPQKRNVFGAYAQFHGVLEGGSDGEGLHVRPDCRIFNDYGVEFEETGEKWDDLDMAFDILNMKIQPTGPKNILRRKVRIGGITKPSKPKTLRTMAKGVTHINGPQVPKLEVVIT